MSSKSVDAVERWTPRDADPPIDVASLPEYRRKTEMYMRVDGAFGEGPEGFMGGWWAIRIIGDIATDLGIRLDGDTSLIRRYDYIDLVEPLYGGDFARFRGEIVHIGNTSRTIDFTVEKVVDRKPDKYKFNEADYELDPRVVIRGRVVIVVPKPNQRVPLT